MKGKPFSRRQFNTVISTAYKLKEETQVGRHPPSASPLTTLPQPPPPPPKKKQQQQKKIHPYNVNTHEKCINCI